MNQIEQSLLLNPDVVHGVSRQDLLRCEILADLFEATAARQPDHVALIFGTRQLTYGELDHQADLAASRLIEAGVRPGMILGLWLPRGIDLLVAQLAIAKSGAGWLPFDADTPLDRVLVCMEDANALGLVCHAEWTDRFDATPWSVWSAQALCEPLLPGQALRRRETVDPSHPAYVIYTSGSTGKPKGIMISQGSICHFLRAENSVLGIRAEDRVYQGFSVAFDMSFEEIWISYLVGATLWIAPKDLASNPEALPHVLIEHHTTVLHAVPTLLALFVIDVPCLRVINLGGEMCPPALVERWARTGRQVFNSYGPTEATVSASISELKAGEPVTIGWPLPNYTLLVIDTDVSGGPRLMPRGQTGELCIAGPGVSLGYLGREDLTNEKFIANPWQQSEHDGRLYRTGDLALIGPDGTVQCLGRTDDQVKIRGFRVELGEIEAALSEQNGIATVAVILRNDSGLEQLVAYIVAEPGVSVKPASLRQVLGKRLPAYMVPSRFELLQAMPRLTSGKIDRKALKAMTLDALPSKAADAAASEEERGLFSALSRLFPGLPIERTADFFCDLGGHSLLAARLASELRADSRYAGFSVTTVYQERTIGAIADAMALMVTSCDMAPSRQDVVPISSWRRWRCGLAQAIVLPVLVSIRMAQWLAPFLTYHFFTGDPDDSIPFATVAAIGTFLLTTVLEFVLAWAGKWLIAGRLKPGRYPLWGWMYFRWWVADRLVEAVPTYLLSGSSLYPLWLRALGARIGDEAHMGSLTLRAPDLLHIGDRVSIGNACNFENARVEDGQLILGEIRIGDDAYVGSYAVLEGDTELGNWAHLSAQSSLSAGQRVPASRRWAGSPAKDLGAFDPLSLKPRPAVSAWRRTWEALYFMTGGMMTAVLFFLPIFPTFMLIDWLDESGQLEWMQGDDAIALVLKYFLLGLPASAVLVVATVLVSAAIRWIVLPRMKPGSWPVHSRMYLARWLVNQIQESCLQVLHGIYASVYSPMWYRLLGAKVGRDAEVSTALGVVPEMLSLGDETFIADAVMLGDEEIDGGWMTTRPTTVGRRSFVGNCAYIPDGTCIPENLLIGVMSTAPPNGAMQEGETWLGVPPMSLPAREQVQGFSTRLTFNPAVYRRVARGIVEALRIVIPQAMTIAAGYCAVLRVMPAAAAEHWTEVTVQLCLAGLLFGGACFLLVVALKWTLIGRYRKLAVPMWTLFVWCSEAITSLYEGLVIPNFMRYLRGTPWLPVAFRVLGCRIGKGVYMDTTDITEFDCVDIGDHAQLNALSCPQTHLFEDRVMKIDQVVIESGAYIGSRSIVLYGARVGHRARLGPLTLVMKGEHIPARGRWAGCPARSA